MLSALDNIERQLSLPHQWPRLSNVRLLLWLALSMSQAKPKLAEYVGTTMFLFMGFSAAHIANLPGAKVILPDGTVSISTSNLLFIATAFGFSLFINAWLFYRVSGSMFNPAVSLALALARVISPARAALVSVAQVVGGITAAALVKALMSGSLAVNTRLGGNISPGQGSFR